MEYVMKGLKAMEEEVVSKLSEIYKFDKKEAMKRLHEKELPMVPLPFVGEIKKEWCVGMKKNHGLYSQCTGKRINERLCNSCQKEEDKLGKVKEGYIEERLSCNLMDYKDVQTYGNVLEKLNITKEKALEEAARFNVVIPEEQFEVKKKQRGRPAKKEDKVTAGGKGENPPKEVVLNQEKKEDKEDAKIGENTPEGVQGVEPPKKRGRPKKEQKKVVNNCGEELIAALVKEAQKEETEDVFETAKKVKAQAKQEEKKKEQAEKKKEQAKQIEEQAKQAAKKREEEEQAKQAAKKREEEEKKIEEQKKRDEEKNKENASDELCEEEVESEEEEEVESEEEGVRGNVEFPCDEEEITVSKFEFNGKKYLKSSDNILYDPISQDPVGIWNEDDECIDEIEDDE